MRGMEKIRIRVILGLGAINLFNIIQEHGYIPTFSTIRGPRKDASTDQIGHLRMHQIGMKNLFPRFDPSFVSQFVGSNMGKSTTLFGS